MVERELLLNEARQASAVLNDATEIIADCIVRMPNYRLSSNRDAIFAIAGQLERLIERLESEDGAPAPLDDGGVLQEVVE